MVDRNRITFWGIFAGSALLHAAVILGLSVPPASTTPERESVLVILSAPVPVPTPQVEPDPASTNTQPLFPSTNKPKAVDAAIPDEAIQETDREEDISLSDFDPPAMPVSSDLPPVPVSTLESIPGDPTNEAIVRSWLERQKRYPRVAVAQQIEGDVMLYMRLRPDGSVVKMALRTSSGYEILDREVRRMVDRASPFPLTPDTQVDTEYLIPIDFRLE